MRALTLLFWMGVLSWLPFEVSASEVVVRDCSGGIIAHRPIDVGQKVALEILLEPKSKFVPANLVSLRGDLSVAGMLDGEDLVRFEELVAGEWRLCGAQGEDVSFTQIEIITVDQSSGVTLAKYVASAGAVLAPVALIGSERSGDSGGNEALIGPGAASNTPVVDAPFAATDDGPEFLDEDFEFGAQAAPLSPAS